MQIPSEAPARQTPLSFWIIGVALIAYVALCTANRDRHLQTDAWEHHRVLIALTEKLWEPGNPTYASSEPSVRYSPYFVILASLCQTTGFDPYDALSMAAVLNTILMLIGLRMLLGQFGKSEVAGAALVVMVSLYGGAPGYANSYALADLPWHQVNPSAFSFALTLIIWALFKMAADGRAWAKCLGVTLLSTWAMLDHPMTGAFCLLGLFVFAATDEPGRRRQRLLQAVGVSLGVASLCLLWPWYSFRTALLWKGDREFWFNAAILRVQLTEWCAPALLAIAFVLPWRSQPLVRSCLVGALLMFALSVLAFVIKSPTLARLLLPGMVFLHVPIAIFVHDARLLRLSSWPERLRGLLSYDRATQAIAAGQVVLAVGMLYCLLPQLYDIAIKPYLGRPHLERLLNRPEKTPSPRTTLTPLTEPVRPGDVVLTDPITSWHVPSVCRGRIVAAIHFELFVPNQAQRMQDLNRFFSATTNADRRAIVSKYDVRWILLDRDQLGESLFMELTREKAIAKHMGNRILMDASIWSAQTTTEPGSP